MSAVEEKLPLKLNWDGEELEAVLKMIQIFNQIGKRDGFVTVATDEGEMLNWIVEDILQDEWAHKYFLSPQDLTKARAALGRCGQSVLLTRNTHKTEFTGVYDSLIWIDVPRLAENLLTYGIEIPDHSEGEADFQNPEDVETVIDRIDLPVNEGFPIPIREIKRQKRGYYRKSPDPIPKKQMSGEKRDGKDSKKPTKQNGRVNSTRGKGMDIDSVVESLPKALKTLQDDYPNGVYGKILKRKLGIEGVSSFNWRLIVNRSKERYPEFDFSGEASGREYFWKGEVIRISINPSREIDKSGFSRSTMLNASTLVSSMEEDKRTLESQIKKMGTEIEKMSSERSSKQEKLAEIDAEIKMLKKRYKI